MGFVSVKEGRQFHNFAEFSERTGFKEGDHIELKDLAAKKYFSGQITEVEKGKAISVDGFYFDFEDLELYCSYLEPNTKEWTYCGVPYILIEKPLKPNPKEPFKKFKINDRYYSDSKQIYEVLDRYYSRIDQSEYLVLYCQSNPSITGAGKCVQLLKNEDYEWCQIEDDLIKPFNPYPPYNRPIGIKIEK